MIAIFHGAWMTQAHYGFRGGIEPPIRATVTIEVEDGVNLGPMETPVVTARLDTESFDTDNEEHVSSLQAQREVLTPMDPT
jgi:hypothetical protein